MTSTPPPGASALRIAMARDHLDLIQRLSLGLTLGWDATLRQALRQTAHLADDGPLAVKLPGAEAWIDLGPPSFCALSRTPPHDRTWIDLEEMLLRSPALGLLTQEAVERSRAQEAAMRLLEPLFAPSRSPRRREVDALLVWSPLLEQVAYRLSTRAIQLLDQLRGGLQAARISGAQGLGEDLQDYWSTVHIARRASDLATSTPGQPWLVDMARRLSWRTWTPSFPLARERTLWLVLGGGRAASAFGAGVLDRYLSRLAACDHPMKAFDALLGLVAIGLSEPGCRPALLAALELGRGSGLQDATGLVRPMLQSAMRVLRAPDLAVEAWRDCLPPEERPAPRGAIPASLANTDPTQLTGRGDVVAFLALAGAGRSAAQDYPEDAGADPTLVLSAAEIDGLVGRAWGEGPWRRRLPVSV